MSRRNNQLKMYLTLITLTLIILIFWAATLKDSIRANQTTNSDLSENNLFKKINNDWQQASQTLKIVTKKFKSSKLPSKILAPASQKQNLQPAAKLNAKTLEELSNLIKNDIATSSSSSLPSIKVYQTPSSSQP